MTNTSRSVVTAMFGAAAVTAQVVSGKATRDALFLTSHDVTSLPTMLIVTSICSMLLVTAHSRLGRRIVPETLIPLSFLANGLLFLAEWLFRSAAPQAIAVTVYLHVSVAGPLLSSGFWLIATESFSPRTAKKGFGRIAAAGTLGGLAGALVSERAAASLGVPGMLLVLACFQFVAAVLVRRLAVRTRSAAAAAAPSTDAAGRSGLRVIAETPYLRQVALLVLLGTTSAALVDYAFKAAAVETFGPGDSLLRFFALYYAATSLVSLLLQVVASRTVLERFGVAMTASTPSIALMTGIVADLLLPGFGSLVAARGGEAVFRGSWFRSGYELFFTPIPPAEKRAAKSIIDVVFDRVGDAVGGGVVRLVLLMAPALQASAILMAALVSSAGAILAARHLNRWYLRTLENSLVRRGSDLEPTDSIDASIAMLAAALRAEHAVAEPAQAETTTGRAATIADAVLHDIAILRSSDRNRIVKLLLREEGPSCALVPHVIPLLADDTLADHALLALCKVAEERIGTLTDTLLSPTQDVALRRRLARVYSVCVSQRAADGLLLALDDSRFDVRFQAARSLAAIVDRNPLVAIPRERVYALVASEVAVDRPVWESHRLLDGFVSQSPLDEFVRDRAGQSLAHVFTLLSLALPREPLKIAFRSLQSGDMHLRGTALEYLDGVLPPSVRQALWPFLVYRRSAPAAEHQGERIAALLRSSQSVTMRGVAAGWDRDRVAGLKPV